MLIKPIFVNSNKEPHEHLFCPSEKCFNIPEINYIYNPLKQDIKYKCNCQDNEQKMGLQDFLEKTNIICYYCKKIIKEENFFICSNCNNIFDIKCKEKHNQIGKSFNFYTKNKNNLNNNILCKEHNSPIKCFCEDCNKLICLKCYSFHDDNGHSILQLSKYFSKFFINQNEFDKLKSTFKKQKDILDEIKKINNDIISSLENDLKIKQKIIDNYDDNKTNNISNINIKNLYLINDEKYEVLLQKILSKKEERQNQEKDIDKFLDEILLIFYYSLMILKDKSFANELINGMEQKIAKFKTSEKQNIDDKNNIKDNKNSNFEEHHNSTNFLSNNNNVIINSNSEPINSVNINPSNINVNLNTQADKNLNNKNFQEKHGKNSINDDGSLNPDINIINDENKNIENSNYIINNKNQSIKPQPVKEINENKTSKIQNTNKEDDKTEKVEEEKNDNKEIKKKEHEDETEEEDNNFISNLIALKSGNFAISKKNKVEIYDFKKLDYTKDINVYDEDLIKENNCLLQELSFVNNSGPEYISYIFQFPDESLLCSLYSQIIIIKLTNNDKSHFIIGHIKLDYLELPRKLISLGHSLLTVLSERECDCFIKIYEKNEMEKLQFKNPNDRNKYEFNNKYIKNHKNIKEDSYFKELFENFNEPKRLFVSIFEIKKDKNAKIEGDYDINFSKYLYEFVATSNSVFELGKDKVIFYGIIKDNAGEYQVCTISEINNISCSVEPDSICQINDKYLCIGLQDYNKLKQVSGFALINIYTRKLYKKIRDKQINSLYYDKENSLLIASMEVIIERYIYYYSKIYKITVNKENEENDKIEFKRIYSHRNEQIDVIISLNKISNKKLIFVTSSQCGDLEIVKTDIQ